MFEVLHPYNNTLITHLDYIKLALDSGFQRPNDYVGGRCPVCKREMKIRAGHKKDDSHFYHNDSEFCPTKDPASRPYLGKVAAQIDPYAVNVNREFVRSNVECIWSRLSEIIPYLDLREFIAILQEARRLNVYGYVGLVPELIPYVFVTLINFLPSKSREKKRKLKFFFFYDSSVKEYGDLWIDKGIDSDLVRISYRNSETIRVKIFDMESQYLSRQKFRLSEKQKNWVLDEI